MSTSSDFVFCDLQTLRLQNSRLLLAGLAPHVIRVRTHTGVSAALCMFGGLPKRAFRYFQEKSPLKVVYFSLSKQGGGLIIRVVGNGIWTVAVA